VPQLADDRWYLASESTIYRLQRRYRLRTKARSMSRTDRPHAASAVLAAVAAAVVPELPEGRIAHHLLDMD